MSACPHGCRHEQRPCPECGEMVEFRYTRVGLYYSLRGVEFKLGPEHARRCPHWRESDA